MPPCGFVPQRGFKKAALFAQAPPLLFSNPPTRALCLPLPQSISSSTARHPLAHLPTPALTSLPPHRYHLLLSRHTPACPHRDPRRVASAHFVRCHRPSAHLDPHVPLFVFPSLR
ncbi:hypothetical protein K438DRAFT_1857763, partial [Mycena galopus ATCC 62051]